ncbi:MAG: hypothetical protein ACRD03_05185, partial [Acidimicrobiales bacterium]
MIRGAGGRAVYWARLQHELALPRPAEPGEAGRRCRGAVVIVVGDMVQDLDGELAAGRVRCPGCHGALRPWGFARPRSVRTSPG